MMDESETRAALQAIHQDMTAALQRRLRARMLEKTQGGDRLPFAPHAFTRVLERGVSMSPRPHPRSGTRLSMGNSPGLPQRAESGSPHGAASSPSRSPLGAHAFSAEQPSERRMGKKLRPKSAPMRSKGAPQQIQTGPRAMTSELLDDNAPSDPSPVPGMEFDMFNDCSLDRSGMHLASALGPEKMRHDGSASEAQLEHILLLLRSQDTELQKKGIQTMESLEYSAANVEKLTQQGHLDALCGMTAAFLRMPRRAAFVNSDIENEAGFRALHIMFKIGAVSEGFRAVAAAVVALAMPQAPDVRPADPGSANTKELPPLSQILSDGHDPMNLGDVDKHQHLSWNPMSINLQGLPPSNRRAVQYVGMGAHLTVYTMSLRERKKALHTFVQLLPTGALFIGGKEQHVSVLSVVQGSTAAIDGAFHISGHARACIFRVHAMPRDCALAASEPVSLAFGANSVEERNWWVQGISIIALRYSAGRSSVTAALPLEQAVEPGGNPSYQGAVDANGVPCGLGMALSADGSKHIGHWKGGMLSGNGALLQAAGGKYMGHWKDGLAHGFGVQLAAGGMRYEGEWVNDAWHGLGMEFDAAGLVFCGSYLEGQRHGQGLVYEQAIGALLRHVMPARVPARSADRISQVLIYIYI